VYFTVYASSCQPSVLKWILLFYYLDIKNEKRRGWGVLQVVHFSMFCLSGVRNVCLVTHILNCFFVGFWRSAFVKCTWKSLPVEVMILMAAFQWDFFYYCFLTGLSISWRHWVVLSALLKESISQRNSSSWKITIPKGVRNCLMFCSQYLQALCWGRAGTGQQLVWQPRPLLVSVLGNGVMEGCLGKKGSSVPLESWQLWWKLINTPKVILIA